MAKFIIAAPSARGLAEAAVACGHQVIALDAFADADTQAIAAQAFKLTFNEFGGDFCLDETYFKHVFLQINLAEIDGFLYGSLFDHAPDLLAWVAERVPLVGNAPEVMCAAKRFGFFKLLDALKITHPEVCLSPPEAPEDWLCKKIGGTGGRHICAANQVDLHFVKPSAYFQRKMPGKPISMLFVADGNIAQTIGFNQQLIAPTDAMPFRFAGAVSNIALQPNIYKDFEYAAQQLTRALNLRGINSLDAMLDGDALWMLELNPRVSATFELYENLLPRHLQGCAGSLEESLPQRKTSKAQLILYANEAVNIPANFVWPHWAADIPALAVGESSISMVKNMPICSVFAQAESAEVAQSVVQQRVEALKEMLKND